MLESNHFRRAEKMTSYFYIINKDKFKTIKNIKAIQSILKLINVNLIYIIRNNYFI